MIQPSAVLLAVAAPAAAELSPLSFETGKSIALSSGQWSYAATATGSEARFGTHLSLRCDRATRTITVVRPALPAGALTIVTDTASRALPTNGRLSAYDPLLDAMAFSRGRFLVAGGSAPVLAVPSWPEGARAVEDCRN